MEKEFKSLSDKESSVQLGGGSLLIYYPPKDVKEFIRQRVYDATKLLALFNQGKLTSIDLREHRQNIKEKAGGKLV